MMVEHCNLKCSVLSWWPQTFVTVIDSCQMQLYFSRVPFAISNHYLIKNNPKHETISYTNSTVLFQGPSPFGPAFWIQWQ